MEQARLPLVAIQRAMQRLCTAVRLHRKRTIGGEAYLHSADVVACVVAWCKMVKARHDKFGKPKQARNGKPAVLQCCSAVPAPPRKRAAARHCHESNSPDTRRRKERRRFLMRTGAAAGSSTTAGVLILIIFAFQTDVADAVGAVFTPLRFRHRRLLFFLDIRCITSGAISTVTVAISISIAIFRR